MKKPFELNPNPETAGEAFRRIATDHGYPVGEDGKIVDSGFHPGNWPDGQPKQWISDDAVPLDPKVCAAAYMAVMDKDTERKIKFADHVLKVLTSDDEWNADTFGDFIDIATALYLINPVDETES